MIFKQRRQLRKKAILQKSWNYRQLKEEHTKNNMLLLKLLIPGIIFFILIFGDVYSNTSSLQKIRGSKDIGSSKIGYHSLKIKIEKLFTSDDWYGISKILDDIPTSSKYEDLINFCKGIKYSFVQIGKPDPIDYFKGIKQSSNFFVLSRLALTKYYFYNYKNNSSSSIKEIAAIMDTLEIHK